MIPLSQSGSRRWITAMEYPPGQVALVSVLPGLIGIAVVTWLRPLLKADGSVLPLGDVTGYVIRRYSTGGALASTSNAGAVLTLQLTGIPSGAWDFTVAAVSATGEGAESAKGRVTVL